MCRILFVSVTFGLLVANAGCRSCCRPAASYCPSHGPYNPYAGNCVNEDIWTTPGHSGCHCGHSHCGCGSSSYPTTSFPTTSNCDCHAPVSNCGCGAPVSHDCGCGGAFGDQQVLWGEPVYDDPISVPGPPQAPPSSEEYYVPARPDDFEPDQSNEARNRNSALPATLVVPARL